MKKIINKILNIYDIVLLTALIITGFRSVKTPIDLIFPFLLLPVFFYFTGGLIRQFKKTNWLFFIYSFLFSIIILVADLVNVRHLKDLVLVGIVLPLPMYLLIMFLKKIKSFKKINKLSLVCDGTSFDPALAGQARVVELEDKKDIDETKRKFLKLLAGTGLTTVFLYMFNAKKAQAAFFGNGSGPAIMSLKDSSGNKIDPAVNSPTDGYGIGDIASVSTNNYYGYVNKDAVWYVLKEDTTNNSFQYASLLNNTGVTTYAAAWSGKTGLTYGSFSDAF